ncbi:predicted protein [Sclerotinia sclerotiorum 1980 UF-70]|uniref:Uncharacterized protein n=1 Tax=Sclerotinia sclerotiorum (strain ATCC 18683 / 1980 / Ss-1) TaxID=665079 RepID=A7EHS4_SCLS1|nr:predicted protein [Sclerotinia sclerotiorum 1980 UF-70]EDO02390.1 predicted protein [Sclerotinia sclerotiorum 1980 UF-70]
MHKCRKKKICGGGTACFCVLTLPQGEFRYTSTGSSSVDVPTDVDPAQIRN